MWQQILKAELASKTGFSQLDFDNVVIEDEDNCKERLKQLAKKIENIRLDILDKEIEIDEDKPDYLKYFPKGTNKIASVYHKFDDSLPEEVYCKAIELLKGAEGRLFTENVMGYSITTSITPLSKLVAISKLGTIDSSYPPLMGEHHLYLRYFMGRWEEIFPDIRIALEEAFNVV